MTFLAGEKIRASELNSYVLQVARATADLTKTNNTLADVTGMSVSLEASATYIFDGYMAWNAASTTPDFKMAFTVPSGATGHWSLFTLATGSTVPGNLDAQHATSLTTALTGATDATLGVAARPAGFVVTTNAGTIQVQAAQNTTNATTLTVRTGSWVRFQRVA